MIGDRHHDHDHLRFSGKCRVQYCRAGALVEEFTDKAIWSSCTSGMRGEHARAEWQRQRGCG